MRTRKFFGLALSSVLSLSLFAGCGDDDDNDGSSSRGGAAGNSGASGGSSNRGGGSNRGGASNLGGAATLGGASSEAGQTGDGGEMELTAGAGGETGGETVAQCSNDCDSSDDCRQGTSSSYHCGNTGKCEALNACTEKSQCLPINSGWIWECEADEDCPDFEGGEVCVEANGIGLCALGATEVDECSDLAAPDIVQVQHYGDTETVSVCGDAAATCVENLCISGCLIDSDCSPAQNGSVCDVPSGVCKCQSDDDCDGPGVSKCDTATGRCGCGSNADCTVGGNDQCVDGRCGCASAASCPSPFNSAPAVCE